MTDEKRKSNSEEYTLKLPAVRGIQGGRTMFSANIPLRLVERVLQMTDEELPPEMRAQRTLNQNRAKAIAKYMAENQRSYVLPSLTLLLEIPQELDINPARLFKVAGETKELQNVGTLSIPLDAKLLVADGQHRRAGITEALKLEHNLGHDTISVVIFHYDDLKAAQRMFHDINANAKKINGSLLDLYDQHDPWAWIARQLCKIPQFGDRIEKEKSSVGKQPGKLFTLNHLKKSLKAMFRGNLITNEHDEDRILDTSIMAIDFFQPLVEIVPDWEVGQADLSDMREISIAGHAVYLEALGILFSHMLDDSPEERKTKMSRLASLDYSRHGWEHVCVFGGRMSNRKEHTLRLAAVLYLHCFHAEPRRLPLELYTPFKRLEEIRPGFQPVLKSTDEAA